MKPVDLNPGNSPVAVKVPGAKPNLGAIGGIAVGLVAVLGVGAYFAMARVDSVKSETTAAQQATSQAQAETQAAQSQIQSIGKPINDSDHQLAQGAEQVLVSAYTERYDFVLLAKELRGIMTGTGGWYESVSASSTGTSDASASASPDGGKSVTIIGYMPTSELAASFDQRINGTKSLTDADFDDLKTVRLIDSKTKRRSTYWKFTISANLVDTKAPFAATSTGGSAGGTTVGDSDSTDLKLSLDSEPATTSSSSTSSKKPQTAAPAKPKNPFDVAAAAASGGGSNG